jgi:hypothetical protein
VLMISVRSSRTSDSAFAGDFQRCSLI